VLLFASRRIDRVVSTPTMWRKRLVLAVLPTAALWFAEFALALDPGTRARFLGALPAGAGGAAWLVAVARGDLR
jgi:hypothetical protein